MKEQGFEELDSSPLPSKLDRIPDYMPTDEPKLLETREGDVIEYENRQHVLQKVKVTDGGDIAPEFVNVKDLNTSRVFDIDLSHPKRAHLFSKDPK
ncbi:MAG: hypothetical protein JWP09_502 [Candidatus Taylorbacteria bacterium]|nr:hypothetical protein [Candidatus Taylorbacteria bacterium]